jgi:two-component system response regulator FixJ
MSSRTVYLVDHDRMSRVEVLRQLTDLQLEAWPFPDAAPFLEMLPKLDPSCILYGADMSDPHAAAALDAIAELVQRAAHWPLIVLASGGDTRIAVEAMKRGATDYLQRPLPPDRLGEAIAAAGLLVEGLRRAQEARRAIEARLARLTPRERDVARALLGGMGNKAAAHHLGLSVRTVEMHRSRMLHKIGARTIAEGAAILARAGMALAAAAEGAYIESDRQRQAGADGREDRPR